MASILPLYFSICKQISRNQMIYLMSCFFVKLPLRYAFFILSTFPLSLFLYLSLFSLSLSTLSLSLSLSFSLSLLIFTVDNRQPVVTKTLSLFSKSSPLNANFGWEKVGCIQYLKIMICVKIYNKNSPRRNRSMKTDLVIIVATKILKIIR